MRASTTRRSWSDAYDWGGPFISVVALRHDLFSFSNYRQELLDGTRVINGQRPETSRRKIARRHA